MAVNNDGWTVVTDPREQHAYASSVLPSAPPGKRGKVPSVAPSGDMLETQTDRDRAKSAMDAINRVQPALDAVRKLYNENLRGAGPVQSLREYLPSQGNSKFDAAAAQLRASLRPAQQTPGQGSISDYETKLANEATPDRFNFDGGNEQAIEGLQAYLDMGRATYAKRAGLPTPPPSVRKAPSREYTIDLHGNLVR